MANLYRQGDVLFSLIKAVPEENRTTRANGVVAYGEVTGHKHAVADLAAAEVLEISDSIFVRVSDQGGVSIVHDEHAPILLPRGDYAVTIQREYTPDAIRNVLD